MPYLSRNDIERIAAGIIRDYRKLPALQGKEPERISPQLLIQMLGLTVEYWQLSRDGSLLGVTSCRKAIAPVYVDGELDFLPIDGKTLLIDSSMNTIQANIGRRNFTLTHEACHQILFMLYPQEYQKSTKLFFYSPNTRPSDYWEEWRANALSAAVLMPADIVHSNMRKYGLGEKLVRLNRWFAGREYEAFCKMAAAMQVSKEALAIRMQQLGLLERNELADPLKDTLITMDDDELMLFS